MKGRWLLLMNAVASLAVAEVDDPASTARDERPLTFEIGTGVEYDSNVAVLELDATADAGDTAALLELGLGYDLAETNRFDLQTGYNFSETLHEDFDAFDVRIHRASATASYDLDRVDVGAMYQYAHAELDGEEFLTLAQVSPYVSKLIGKRLFLRFAYAHTDKDFASNPLRDATAEGLTADAYVFLNGLTTYLAFGYRYDDEDAIDAQFDYSGRKLNAQLSRRFSLHARELTFKTYLRYETRDYAGATPSIGVPRDDNRYQLETSLEIPITERLVTRIGMKYADNRSNLPSVDFDETVFSVGVSARL